jgi:gamma-glutamyl phosphate reductase
LTNTVSVCNSIESMSVDKFEKYVSVDWHRLTNTVSVCNSIESMSVDKDDWESFQSL